MNARTWKLVGMLVCVSIIVLSLAACGTSSNTSEEEYPTRTIRIIDPNSAGGASDRLARTIAPYLAKEMGVDVVVENRPGAGSQIGTTVVADSYPDGYTLISISEPQFAGTIELQGASYELNDFAWLTMNHQDHIAINVLHDKPWNDFKELVEYIQANPGEVSIGVTQASGPHIFIEYLKEKLNLDLVVVPYNGGGPGRAALIGGHVDAFFAQTMSNVEIAEQSKCLGVGAKERSVLWPDCPSFDELFDDEEIVDTAMSLASYRGFKVQRAFKEEHPDRFENLVQSLKKAYESEGHMEDSEKVGQTPILWFSTPEEGEEISGKIHELVRKYKHLFE